MNEEELKIQVVLPWLRSLGIRVEDLSFEESFSVPVGRGRIDIGDDTKPRGKRARLDILVRRGDRNLAVIELKRPSEGLTDADREQAISYARLVHPPAPLALVTNGSEFRLYDSISKDLITPESSRFEDGYSVTLPRELHQEALRLFLGMSHENLLAFCRKQVAREAGILSGRVTDIGSVYTTDLYVKRPELERHAQEFLNGAATLFVLVGESGRGKSCFMVELAHRLIESGAPTLFIRGASAKGDLLEDIRLDINRDFGPGFEGLDLLRRLSIAADGRRPVILVDALDEWGHPHRGRDFATFVRHVKEIGGRLIVSCKTRAWQEFLEQRGLRTGVESEVFRGTGKPPHSAEIQPYSPKEFYEVVAAYRQLFGHHGVFEDTALAEAKRSPWLLRLLFHVAVARSDQHLALSPAFFEDYVRLVSRLTSNPEAAQATLVGLGGLLAERDHEWVDETSLRRELRLGANERILPELFDRQILTANEQAGVRRIGFGSTHLRNYVIAFQSRRWQESTAEDFERDLNRARPTGVLSEAIFFYYPFAPLAHQRAIDGEVRPNAEAYLQLYVDVLAEHFPSLRSRFAPFTDGEIGFVGELLPASKSVAGYGFRRLEPSQQRIHFVPVDVSFESNRPYLAGISRFHWASSSKGFRGLDVQRNVLLHEVRPQLRELVKKGNLSDAGSPQVAEEVILNAVQSNPSIFGRLLRNGEILYPLPLSSVETELRRERYKRIFHDDRLELKRRSGEASETWHGDRVSASYTWTAEDEASIQAQADDAIRTGRSVESRTVFVDLRDLTRRLMCAIADRRLHSDVIEHAPLPLRDEIEQRLRRKEALGTLFLDHVRSTLPLAIANYVGLVETNFPTLVQSLTHFSLRTASIIVRIPDDPLSPDGAVWLYFCERSGDRTITFYPESEVTCDGEVVRYPGGEESVTTWRMFDPRVFIRGAYAGNLECDRPGSVIRRFVYSWLNSDLRRLEETLLSRYGVDEFADLRPRR